MPDIVVYGGEPGGVAAALSAARRSPAGTEVALVFPESAPGGSATVGGVCAWESRAWMHGSRRAEPQGGNFAVWRQELGAIYDPARLAGVMQDDLRSAGVRVFSGHDLEAVALASAPGRGRGRSRVRRPGGGRLNAVRLRPLEGGERGPAFAAGAPPVELTARVFIDASASGRLARLAGVATSVGRSDWNSDGRQMAATLLFAVEHVDWDALVGARDNHDKPVWGTASSASPHGTHRSFWGGAHVATDDPVLAAFNDAHPGFRIGAPRAWEEGGGVFWMSALLVYNVDGRRRCYDAGSERDTEPVTILSHDVDTAYRAACRLVGPGDLLGALRRFPGLEEVRLAERAGRPRTGETLVLRETVHSLGPKPEPFAVTADDVTGAGTGPQDGRDARHWLRRVGLGFYWLENTGYTEGEILRTTAAAANPVYLPLDTLLCPAVPNLLLPGYAARIESRAWWALRTAPNLCVLGDAAGVAAAFTLREDIPATRFGNPELAAVQSWLVGEGAILDKWS